MTGQKKGWLTVQIREQVKNSLLEIYNQDRKRPENQSFTAYLDQLLKDTISFNKQVTEYGPFLEFSSAIDNHIAIKDNTMDRLVTVYINADKKELQCDFCHKTNCLHVGFCFVIPEVYSVLIDLGFRPRKPKRKKI
ncbi:MAG: hypothetical protein DA328_01490 [Nitrososphaeraceae archaeon]|nr:hypothetical protein [Nitrososphaeraceae archaeon]